MINTISITKVSNVLYMKYYISMSDMSISMDIIA